MDEKRLDVEGSYNVRYEIIKKRIDKALLKGTQERLTQSPGTSPSYMHASRGWRGCGPCGLEYYRRAVLVFKKSKKSYLSEKIATWKLSVKYR
ncbi:MAG: hypothetical protein EPO28_13950 [Saprospiraceae bacterium]|nr:MAG: hypothetical protein EPO28_13950 [Saprospiraceae bacterium]